MAAQLETFRPLDPEEVPALLSQLPSMEQLLAENEIFIAEDGKLLIPDPWQEACPSARRLKFVSQPRGERLAMPAGATPSGQILKGTTRIFKTNV